MEFSEEQKSDAMDHHRQLLAHLDIKRERDDRVSYDDAMWLMMRAAEFAVDRPDRTWICGACSLPMSYEDTSGRQCGMER